VTNTIFLPDVKRYDRLAVLSVGNLLATAIANTHSDKSVSSLFD
jgi:phosphoribosylpyrophosphate synthetase